MKPKLKTYDVTLTTMYAHTLRIKAETMQDAICAVYERYTYPDNVKFDHDAPPHVEPTKVVRVAAN